ncbi:MAG TPA: hypothetical protein VG326_01490 [Tepidisphaeraceae bacterium]|jgi:hypothetical protein|nr:hypothetical protein [Tepidisphaeraceae bacterium]
MESTQPNTPTGATPHAFAAPIYSVTPIFAWLLIQVAAIALAACRVPLWPHAPQAGEFLAVEILLVVQILGAALLSPRLCERWPTTLMAIACAWPFQILAGFLAATSIPPMIQGGLYVSGWIAALWGMGLPFRSRIGRSTLSAAASTWAAAGPILLFIGNEYPATPFHPGSAIARGALGPIIDSLIRIGPDAPQPGTIWGWPELAGVGLVGMSIVLIVKRGLFSRG